MINSAQQNALLALEKAIQNLEDLGITNLSNLKEEVINIKEQLESPTQYLGGRKSMMIVKTNRKYKGRDGIERTLYKKGDNFYVKKMSTKTGKMTWSKVRA